MSRVHRSYHRNPKRWMHAPSKPKKLYSATDWFFMCATTFAITFAFGIIWLAGG